MEAITVQQYKKVSEQIKKDQVDVNARYVLEGFGEVSILHVAIFFDDYNLIKYLLDHHVDVNRNEATCGTALHFAVSEKLKYTTVRRILWASADVNAQDYQGNSALHLAVRGNRYNVAQMLLEHGADVDMTCQPMREFDCWTPLDLAIIENKLELMNLLLNYETDIDCKSKAKYSPLVIASLYGTVTAVEIILRKGADINHSKDTGLITEYPLQAAVTSGDRIKVQHLLRNVHVLVNKRDRDGDTALHYAMNSPSNSSLQYLLDAGADVNLVDSRGQLPICLNERESGENKKHLLKRHLVKIEAAGYPLAEENLKAIGGKEFVAWRKKCEEELEVLKKTFNGGTNFSLFTVLHKDQHWLARRIKRIDEGIFINSNIRKVFPIYGNMLHNEFKLAANRKQLLINVENTIDDVLFNELPDTFLRCLSSFFTNKDLEIMNGDKANYSLWV